jgi:threonine/homoserine/homoserine lactone efflux protein
MKTEQEAQEDAQFDEELLPEQEEYEAAEDEKIAGQPVEQEQKTGEQKEDRGSFIHGLSVGLGMGCIATFVIMWISVFFSPQLPSTLTYETMLAVFIYPLIYLLTVGLVALTAGIVREYYMRK